MKTSWIACADAVPQENGLYIIYAPSLDEDCPLIVVISWHKGEWSGLVPMWLEAITHWMPLPEPPYPSD